MTARALIVGVAVVAALSQLATSSLLTTTFQHRNDAPFPKLLLWNASASAPRGLYLLRPAQPLQVGELVAVTPPEPLARFAAMRGYLPSDVPLLKHVAALRGQTVCRFADRITIDDHTATLSRERDTHGRSLPHWQGCRTLRTGEVFVLNPTIPDSFDGRYFGPLPCSSVTSRAIPVWTEAAP
jgi:conjugative transfer signal peptidase TraF